MFWILFLPKLLRLECPTTRSQSLVSFLSTFFPNLRVLNTMCGPTTQKSLPLDNSILLYTTVIQHFYLYIIIHSRWTLTLPPQPFYPNSSPFQLVSYIQVKNLDDILDLFPNPQSHHLQILLTTSSLCPESDLSSPPGLSHHHHHLCIVIGLPVSIFALSKQI